MPATSKVLSIIDKGVRDRVTKNGETLRRHAESAQRWQNLRERIARTDTEMEAVRQILVNGDATPSENGSSTSSSKYGYLVTPPSASRTSRAPSSASTLSRSISPFRKFARKITGNSRGSPFTPSGADKSNGKRTPSSEPVPTLRKQKGKVLSSLRGSEPPTPATPDRTGHKYSQSLTPDSAPRVGKFDVNSTTIKGRTAGNKQPWNSSTKVEPEERSATIKGTPPRRPPSSGGWYGHSDDIPPVPSISTPYRRSISRASLSSSRPFSPNTSSTSAQQSSQFSILRPPSRAQTPVRGVTPNPGLGATPRPRPKTPSHIPQPSRQLQITPGRSEKSEDDVSYDRRAFSPTLSASAMSVTSSGFGHPPRPPSRSMIPVPSLHLSSPSRPGSAMSDYNRIETFRTSASRAQTPENAVRTRAQQVPFLYGTVGRAAGRPSVTKVPKRGATARPARMPPPVPSSVCHSYLALTPLALPSLKLLRSPTSSLRQSLTGAPPTPAVHLARKIHYIYCWATPITKPSSWAWVRFLVDFDPPLPRATVATNLTFLSSVPIQFNQDVCMISLDLDRYIFRLIV